MMTATKKKPTKSVQTKKKEIKHTQSIRLSPETLEKVKNIAPEGNVSLWVRQLIEKTIK